VKAKIKDYCCQLSSHSQLWEDLREQVKSLFQPVKGQFKLKITKLGLPMDLKISFLYAAQMVLFLHSNEDLVLIFIISVQLIFI